MVSRWPCVARGFWPLPVMITMLMNQFCVRGSVYACLGFGLVTIAATARRYGRYATACNVSLHQCLTGSHLLSRHGLTKLEHQVAKLLADPQVFVQGMGQKPPLSAHMHCAVRQGETIFEVEELKHAELSLLDLFRNYWKLYSLRSTVSIP